MNPDPETTRVVRAEQFARRVGLLRSRGYTRVEAEARIAAEDPHLACAAEQLRHPADRHLEIFRRFFPPT